MILTASHANDARPRATGWARVVTPLDAMPAIRRWNGRSRYETLAIREALTTSCSSSGMTSGGSGAAVRSGIQRPGSRATTNSAIEQRARLATRHPVLVEDG